MRYTDLTRRANSRNYAMTIRNAVADDLNDLCAMAKRFVAESDLPFTYSDEASRRSFWHAIQNDDMILLVWADDDVIGGAVLGLVEQDFCYESMGYMLKFYVEQEFRGLDVSRELVRAFENAAARKGARIVFTSSTAGMGERVEKMYVRLFEKQGYNVLGRVLVKEIK